MRHDLDATPEVWAEYDACAMAGDTYSMTPEVQQLIEADPDAYARRCREFAYAEAMRGLIPEES